MSPEEARRQLEDLDRELVEVRGRLAAYARVRRPATAAVPPWSWPVAALGALSVGGLLAAGSYLAGESAAYLWWGLGMFVVAGAAAVALFRRKLLPEGCEVDRGRRALLDREQTLVDRVQEVYDALGDGQPAPGVAPLALPRDRQPRPWASLMTMRFRRERSPDADLRALPADASRCGSGTTGASGTPACGRSASPWRSSS